MFPATNDSQQLMTVSEVASTLRIHLMTAYDWIGRGVLEKVKIGSSVRVPRRAVADFIARSTTPAKRRAA